MSISPEEWSIVLLSLKVACVSVLLLVIPGTALGYLLARYDFRAKAVLDAGLHLPLVMPPVVVGYGLLMVMGRNGWIGAWLDQTFGWQLAFTWQGAALASAIMGFPLMIRAVRLSVEMVDRKLETAARTLGASPWNVFYSVTLPLIAPGILSGVTLAFARSLGEFGATITFAGNVTGETRTLPLAVYAYLQQPASESAALRLVVVSLVLSIIALVVSQWLTRRVKKCLRGKGYQDA